MPATLTRDEMRIYQRARRTRLKAEREAIEPTVDAIALPPGAILKAPAREQQAMWAKVDAIGRGPDAVITKTNGRLDVLRREDFEARHHSPSPSRTVAPLILTPAPRSMVAVGGRAADRSGFGSVATETAAFRANVTSALNQLAYEAVEAKRQREDQERRIAALEAAADCHANVANVMQALAGLFSYAVRC
jgi:hypothetical protein